MGEWLSVFTDGNIILKIIILQAASAVLVLFLLKKVSDRDLFLCALEKVGHVPVEQGADVDEVIVVTAGKLSGYDESRLRAILKERFPRAEVTAGQDRALWGGIVVRAGGHVFDFSLWTRINQLLKRSDV